MSRECGKCGEIILEDDLGCHGCAARFQNATSIEWGGDLEQTDSSVEVKQTKINRNVI